MHLHLRLPVSSFALMIKSCLLVGSRMRFVAEDEIDDEMVVVESEVCSSNCGVLRNMQAQGLESHAFGLIFRQALPTLKPPPFCTEARS